MSEADDKIRALVEQSFQMNELTKHPGWAILVDYMETVVMRAKKKNLLEGRCKSFDEFKETAGFCKGATAVLEAHLAVAAATQGAQEARAAREADDE